MIQIAPRIHLKEVYRNLQERQRLVLHVLSSSGVSQKGEAQIAGQDRRARGARPRILKTLVTAKRGSIPLSMAHCNQIR
jgi:hypothetical protein